MEIEDTVYKGEDYSKKSLENRAFTSCHFLNCNFTESVLRNTKFTHCTFKSCNLSLPKMDGCRIHDGNFQDCKLVGVDFFKCDSKLFSLTLKSSALQYCNFSGLSMKNTLFSDSRLKECQFTGAQLSGSRFSEVDFSGTVFHNTDLSRCDFSSARAFVIDPRVNKVTKAKFSLPEAVGLLHSFDIVLTS